MTRVVNVFLVTIVAAVSALASTDPMPQPAEVVDMQQTIFTSGGLLEVRDSWGDIEIAGWDQPVIEVVVTKSTHQRYSPEDVDGAAAELDRIQVTTRRLTQDHVVIRTEFPAHNLLRPLGGKSNVRLQYRIHVPRQTRLLVRQESGELKIHDVRANMSLSNRMGDIFLSLPETEKYAIDARARVGDVNSEWCAQREEMLTNDGVAPHRLQLRVGVGDITVRKAHIEVETLVD